jgi:hypothetical protein
MHSRQISPELQGLDEFWDGPDGLNQIRLMGIRLMPVMANAKKPLWRNWQFGRDGKPYSSSSSTTDLPRLQEAFSRNPQPNAGIPMGQPWRDGYLCAIDIDPRHGGDVGFTELCDQIGPPPETATSRTLSHGTHIIILCRQPWADAPNEIARGVEFKRAGQFVLEPPSNGYAWVRPPFGEPDVGGIAFWTPFEQYVSMSTAARAATPAVSDALETSSRAAGVDRPCPRSSWGSADDHVLAIASAKPGDRNSALLRLGAKLAYATALGVGLDSAAAVEAALWRACETNGLVDDYPTEELLRKIHVYVTWSDASTNPLLNGSREQDRGHPSVLNPVTYRGLTTAKGAESRLKVLDSLGKFARMEFRPYAAGYGAAWTGLPATNVQRALEWLRSASLIERGPSVYSPGGKRPTHTYRVTPLGKLAIRDLVAKGLP